MRVDPRIAALRADRTAQRDLARAMAEAHGAWKGDHAVALILRDLKSYGEGSALARLPVLERVVQDPEAACDFVDGWITAFLAPLRENPLCEIPFLHGSPTGMASMRIARSGGASLMLLAYQEMPPSVPAQTAFFADREQHEIVISGTAQGVFHTLEHPQRLVRSDTRFWHKGEVIHTQAGNETREVRRVQASFVLLHLERTPAMPQPSKVVALENGALVQQVSGSKHDSQLEMAITVLGSMGRKDAAPAMCALAQDGPAHLRWEALRHALALDAGRGFASLCAAARSDGDDLAVPAARLRDQLARSHPQFLDGFAPCPA